MGVDYWQRIIELERRQMRFETNRLETETRLTQAQTRTNIISSGSFARSSDQLQNIITIYPTVQTLDVQLQSIRVYAYPGGFDSWSTLSNWSSPIAFGAWTTNGTDEPWPIPPDQYDSIFRSSYSGPSLNFFNIWTTLNFQGITNNLTANYSGQLNIVDQTSGFTESYRITADITYNNVADTSTAILKIVSLTGFQMPNLIWYYPISFNANTIAASDKIAAIGTSGSITANLNGTAFLVFKDYDSSTPPKFIVRSLYARNPVLSMRW